MFYHHLLPPCVCVCVCAGAAVATSADLFLYSESRQLASSAGRILLGCLLAFMMDCSEFLALRVTSSVTLCVAGVFKVGPRAPVAHRRLLGELLVAV